MWQALLNSLPQWIGKVIDGIKMFFAGLYIRRSTRIESERDALHEANRIKTQQLEISARPPADPDAIRDRMRDNDF